MTGTRRPDGTELHLLQPGEYAKQVGGPTDGFWVLCPPAMGRWKDCFGTVSPRIHAVTEHEDGMVTISPSILVSRGSGEVWHGYLTHGVWSVV